MHEYVLRTLNHLERKLYQEKIGRLTKMIADLNVDVDEAPPPPELECLARQTARLFDYIGYVPTPLGLMIRDEPDILDDVTVELKHVVDLDYARAEAAWLNGPRQR